MSEIAGARCASALPLSPLSSARATRVARLRAEVTNCIALAVARPDDPFTADLIDEAIRLGRSARTG